MAPSAGYRDVLELLERETLRGDEERIAPHAYLHTLMQDVDFDLDVEREPAAALRPDGVLLACPLTNALYDADQGTPMKLSTLVQYMRVIKRTHATSGKVQALRREAAELERRPLPARSGAGGPAAGAAYVAVSSRGHGEGVQGPTPQMDVERLVTLLIDGAGCADTAATCKQLIDVVKQGIFGSGRTPDHHLLLLILENVRFLNTEINVYAPVALNCARVVLRERASEIFPMHAQQQTARQPRPQTEGPGLVSRRPKSRTRKGPHRSISPAKTDSSVLPSKFIDRHEASGSADLIVLGKQGPSTISRYQGALSDSMTSAPSALWTPPGVESEVKCAKCGHSSLSCSASMNWKLDELLQLRKTSEELMEERDKAVALYQEAVGARKQAQKDCKDARLEYSRIEALLPVMLEGIQDVTSIVTCAEAEARAQWRQIALIDDLSKEMLEQLDQVFSEARVAAGERSKLHEDLLVTGRKLRKYRSKLDSSKAENAQLTGRLADTAVRLGESEQERRRSDEAHAVQVQALTDEARLAAATMGSEHDAAVSEMRRAHAKSVAETQRRHETEMTHLESRRSKEVADLEAQKAQEVADLKTQMASTKKQHDLDTDKIQSEHEIVLADLRQDHDRQVQEHLRAQARLKDQAQLDVDQIKKSWLSDVAQIKRQHALEVESTRVEHQRRLELVEKEWCLGTRCCREKEEFAHRLKLCESEKCRLQVQVRDLGVTLSAVREKASREAATKGKGADDSGRLLLEVRQDLAKQQEARQAEQVELDELKKHLLAVTAAASSAQSKLDAAHAEAENWKKLWEESKQSARSGDAGVPSADASLTPLEYRDRENIVEKVVEKIVEVPVERVVYRDRVEPTVEKEKTVEKMVIKEVPVEVVKEVEKIVYRNDTRIGGELQRLEEQLRICKSELEACRGEVQRHMVGQHEEGKARTAEVGEDDEARALAEELRKCKSELEACQGKMRGLEGEHKRERSRAEEVSGRELQQLTEELRTCKSDLEACRGEVRRLEAGREEEMPSKSQADQQRSVEQQEQSSELLELTERLQETMKDLEHVRSELTRCQAARDALFLDRQTIEATADEHKHLLAVAREEARAAARKMEDSEAAQLRLNALLESKPQYGYKDVQEAQEMAEMVMETLRERNLECSELKGTIRKMDNELKLLSEDRAKITTHESSARRELRKKYQTSEEGRRKLEIENIKMSAELSEWKNRAQELKHQVLSHKWHQHSGVEQQRREEDGRLMDHLHEALETEAQAREDAERQVEHLARVGRQPQKKESHLFKETLYRSKLLEKDAQRSWGRVAPAASRSPDVRCTRPERHRPTSAPAGGRQRALQAKTDTLNLKQYTGRPVSTHHAEFTLSPSGSWVSPPRSDSKVRYSQHSNNFLLPRVAARYHGDTSAVSGADDPHFEAAAEEVVAARDRRVERVSPSLSLSAVSRVSSSVEAPRGDMKIMDAEDQHDGCRRVDLGSQQQQTMQDALSMNAASVGHWGGGIPKIAEEECSDSD